MYKIIEKILIVDENMDNRYTYQVTWSELDKEYVGLCTEFPSLSWLEKTPDAALKGIRSIVTDVLLDMYENGEKIPEPVIVNSYSENFADSLALDPNLFESGKLRHFNLTH